MKHARHRLGGYATLPALIALVGCQDVIVTAVPVASIEVMPSSVTLVVGETFELDYVARDQSGGSLPGRNVTWSVQDPQVAEIDGDGLLRGLETGTTVARAHFDGVTGEALVLVGSQPAIGLLPSEVSLLAYEGQADPPPQTVAISNVGSGTLSGLNTATVYGAGEPTGWLRTQLSRTTAPANLVLEAEVGSLAEGAYHATVRVASPVATNTPQSVGVTFTVGAEPPRIDLSATEVLFTATRGATQPATTTLNLTNGGGGQLVGLSVASITYTQGQGGWLTAELGGTAAPTTLSLRADPGGLGGLPIGLYRAVVAIAAPGASNSPATVTVTFLITL